MFKKVSACGVPLAAADEPLWVGSQQLREMAFIGIKTSTMGGKDRQDQFCEKIVIVFDFKVSAKVAYNRKLVTLKSKGHPSVFKKFGAR